MARKRKKMNAKQRCAKKRCVNGKLKNPTGRRCCRKRKR